MPKSPKTPPLTEPLFTATAAVIGPSVEELEAALTTPDPLSRAEKVQKLIEAWGPVTHQFATPDEAEQFLRAQYHAAAVQLLTCWREALAQIQDRLATPETLSTKDLITLLGQLGQQVKSHSNVRGSQPQTEEDLDAEIEALETELGIDGAAALTPVRSPAA